MLYLQLFRFLSKRKWDSSAMRCDVMWNGNFSSDFLWSDRLLSRRRQYFWSKDIDLLALFASLSNGVLLFDSCYLLLRATCLYNYYPCCCDTCASYYDGFDGSTIIFFLDTSKNKTMSIKHAVMYVLYCHVEKPNNLSKKHTEMQLSCIHP